MDIHEAIARELVTLLNANDDWATGAIKLGGRAEFRWQPYRDKEDLAGAQGLKVDVIPASTTEELQSRCSTEITSGVHIGIRQVIRGSDSEKEALISGLDNLVKDIKDYTRLKPMAGRAWRGLEQDPLYGRPEVEAPEALYLCVIKHQYLYGTADAA